MKMSRNLVFALTVTGGAMVAAVLAARRRTQRQEAAGHETDMQRWDNECGIPGPGAVVKPPARAGRN
jgi:hypothetical protein